MNHRRTNVFNSKEVQEENKIGTKKNTQEKTIITTQKENLKKEKLKGFVLGKHWLRNQERRKKNKNKHQKYRECRKEKTSTAKQILYRHASVVTFSHHATGPIISTCWVSITHARKPFFIFYFFGAEAIPKGAKREKAPQCKQKIKLTKPELIGFVFIISSLEITEKNLS